MSTPEVGEKVQPLMQQVSLKDELMEHANVVPVLQQVAVAGTKIDVVVQPGKPSCRITNGASVTEGVGAAVNGARRPDKVAQGDGSGGEDAAEARLNPTEHSRMALLMGAILALLLCCGLIKGLSIVSLLIISAVVEDPLVLGVE